MEKAIIAKINGTNYIFKQKSLKKITTGGSDETSDPTDTVSNSSDELERIKWSTEKVHGAIHVDFSKLEENETFTLKYSTTKTNEWKYFIDLQRNNMPVVFVKFSKANIMGVEGFCPLKEGDIYITGRTITVTDEKSKGFTVSFKENAENSPRVVYGNHFQHMIDNGSSKIVFTKNLLETMVEDDDISLEIPKTLGCYWDLKDVGDGQIELTSQIGKASSIDMIGERILMSAYKTTATEQGGKISFKFTHVGKISYSETLQNTIDKTGSVNLELNSVEEGGLKLVLKKDKTHNWKMNPDKEDKNKINIFRTKAVDIISKGTKLEAGSGFGITVVGEGDKYYTVLYTSNAEDEKSNIFTINKIKTANP